MIEGIKLKKIRISGFRGFKDTVTLDLNHNVIILFGSNGVGKSSFFNAIEFAFFGSVEHFKGEEFSSTRDELINNFTLSGEADVQLWIKGYDNVEHHIRRRKRKGKKKTIINFDKYEDEEAQREIEKLLKLKMTNFHSSVYLRQGLLHNLIMAGPKERAHTIDSLIGIRDINEILESIPTYYANDIINDLESKIGRLEAERIGALKALQLEVEDIENELREEDFLEVVSIDSAKNIHKKMEKQINEVMQYSEIIKYPPTLSDWNVSSLENWISKIMNTYKELLTSEDKRTSNLDYDNKHLEDLQLKISYQINNLKNIFLKVKEISSIYREKRIVKKELDKIRINIKQIESKIKVYDKKEELYKAGMEILKIIKDDICPLCNLDINRNELKEHIEKQLIVLQSDKNYEESKIKISDLYKFLNELQNTVIQHDEFYNEIKDVRNELKTILLQEKNVINIDQKIFLLENNKFIDHISNILMKVERQIKNNKNKIKTIKNTRDNILSKIDKNINILSLIINLLDKKEKMSNIRRLLPQISDDRQEIEIKLNKIKDYDNSLNELCNRLEKSRVRASRKILKALSPQMNFIYNRLSPHPVYDQLEISLERGRGRLGRRQLSYMIKATSSQDDDRTFVKTVFSHAQMNIAGLSIFLALVLGATHKLDSIILDEPNQSLDKTHKENLADILREMQNFKQIIVATQDLDFHQILVNELVPAENASRTILTFRGWSPERGPLITPIIDRAPSIIKD